MKSTSKAEPKCGITATGEAACLHREVDRREFLELATLSSAVILIGSRSAAGSTPARSGAPAGAPFASFHSLAPGDVEPKGWLRVYLEKQAQELGGHLPEISFPFTGAFWSGEETPPAENGWWPWEQKGYWIDGAMRCALVLGNEKLMQAPLAAVEFTLQHAQADGYLGPVFACNAELENPSAGNFRWPHTVFFRALAAHGEATGDPRVAEAMQRHYFSDAGRVRYGGPSRDVTNIEGMLWAYERTGNKKLLAMAEQAWSDFLHSAAPGDHESGDLHPDRVFSNMPIHSHGVTYAEKSKLPALLYMHTGNSEHLRFALAAQERIICHHMLIDGIPSTTEDYRATTPLDAHETCDISDHTWSWGYMLMATGNGVWADRIERACFNAGMGAIKKDWKGVQYFSCPNQVIATQDSSHVPFVESSKGWMAYRPNPGEVVACCGGNVHRLLPNYVIRMWMTDSDGGLIAALYGASKVRANVGPKREAVEIQEETDYPFDEKIHFTIRSSKPVKFPLVLRIPGWCNAPELALNNQPIALPPANDGFLRLERTFRPGDRITLRLAMHTVISYWLGGDQARDGIGLEHGPLVYALGVNESWSPVVAPVWSTAKFPQWSARATSAWNYGIAIEESELASRLKVERTAMTGDPWISPPVTLTAPLAKIPGWELRADPDRPDRKMTPALPEISPALFSQLKDAAVEPIALVPYGSTHLRLTIFPEIYPIRP